MRIVLTLSEHQAVAIELMLATSGEPTLDALVTRAVERGVGAPLPARWRGSRPPPRPVSRRTQAAAVDGVLGPGAGCAVALASGDRLRVEQIAGGQCVDLNAFVRAQPEHHFSAARTRSLHGLHPTRGHMLWSNAPETPMLSILEDSAPGHDLCFPACTAYEYEPLTGRGDHPNCTEIQGSLRRRAGLGASPLHDPLNLWLPSEVTRAGRLRSWPAACRRGDHVELVAHLDLIVILNACPDDLYGSSQYEPRPVRLIVTRAPGARRRGRVILAGAVASSARPPQRRRTIDLPDRLRPALERMRAAGWLGDRDSEVVRALLFRWWERASPAGEGVQS
jgi:uncharacterized protein